MANPPPDMGGGRQFIADPNASGISTVVGDMAALNLQLIHALQEVIPDGARALVNNIAAQTRQALAASNASHAREQATRELRPITRVPAAPFGAHANIANIRMHNIPTFSGSGNDSLDIVRWISRIMILAQAHALTFAATINLMIQGSSGGAADYIEQMREEDKTLNQIVQQLEMRYGDLCTPEEARVKCNNMARKEREGLPEFIDRLRLMARMACRLENDDQARRQSIDVLVEGNIRRVLPTSVRNALEERVINRSRMGLPAFTAREVEKECLDLERRREERKLQLNDVGAVKRQARVLKLEEYTDSDSEDDSSSSEDAADPNDEALYQLIMEVKQQRRRYAASGQTVDPQRLYRKAFRKFNQKHPPPQFPRGANNPHGARQAVGVGVAQGNYNQKPQQGPPNKLDTNVRRTIMDLLSLANVTRGHCIQCGLEGHYMHQDACALKDKFLVDKPCAKCGQGLHSADECLKVFQKHYVAQPQGNQANLVQNDQTLNEK